MLAVACDQYCEGGIIVILRILKLARSLGIKLGPRADN